MVELPRVVISFANPLQIMAVAAPVSQLITVTYDQFVITTEGNHVMYNLPVDHFVSMQVGYVDAQGNAATVDGEVSWESSDEAIATVEVDSGDSTICRVMPQDIGQVQITATADADIGAGVRELVTTCDIMVVAGEAVAGSIEPLGEPQPREPQAKR
jgi:hypothetical protein